METIHKIGIVATLAGAAALAIFFTKDYGQKKEKTMRVCVKKYCYDRKGSRKTRRGKKAKKAYCLPGTTHRYKGKCGCKTRGGGFTFLPASRCRRK